MSTQGPDELRAVHAARRELGPEYDDALLDSFVDRAEVQLRQRLDPAPQAQRGGAARVHESMHIDLGPGGVALLALNGVWTAISTLILTVARDPSVYLAQLTVVWIVVALADAAYIGAHIARRSDERRKRAAPPDRARPAVPRQGTGRTASS